MTISKQLHNSKFHREGFDQNCPQCLAEHGIDGIIGHLEACAKQNEADAKAGSGWSKPMGVAGPQAVAAEQRRMIGVLKLYRKATTPQSEVVLKDHSHHNPKSDTLSECQTSLDSRTGK